MGNPSKVRFIDFQTDKAEYKVGPGDEVFVYITANVFTDGLEQQVKVDMTRPGGDHEELVLLPSQDGDNAHYEESYRLDQHSDIGTYTMTARYGDIVNYDKTVEFSVIEG